MRRIAHLALIATLALTSGFLPCRAGKLSVDPNTIKKPAPEQDSRLAQKVTYASGGKRLHSVLNDISALTGVIVSCGDSKSDWHVRDLPVAAHVSDLPLGMLLQSIADASHLAFRSSKTDRGWAHRIVRDAAGKSMLETFLEKKQAAGLARASNDWDTWAGLGGMSDDDLRKKCDASNGPNTPRFERADYASFREFSKLIGGLGPDVKKRLVAGEQIILTARDSSPEIAATVKSLHHQMEDERMADSKTRHPNCVVPDKWDFTKSELDSMYLSLSFHTGDFDSGFLTSLMGSNGGREPAFNLPIGWSKDTDALTPHPLTTPRGSYSKNLRRVEDSYEGGGDFDHLQGLQVTLKVAKEVTDSPRTLADAIFDIASATGYSVICEDFPASNGVDIWGKLAGKEVTLGGALRTLSYSANGICWWLDEKQRLLVSSSENWCVHHANLVPESMVQALISKMDGDGVELDDALPVAWLTDGQRTDWISLRDDTADLNWRMAAFEKPLWGLYDSLSSDDRALAKSSAGLSLEKFDSQYLSKLFRESQAAQTPVDVMRAREKLMESHNDIMQDLESEFMAKHPELADRARLETEEINPRQIRQDIDEITGRISERLPEVKTVQTLPSDPTAFSKLVLRVVKVDREKQSRKRDPKTGRVVTTYGKDGIARHTYYLSIGGGGFSFYTNASHASFPVYSLKPENQVREEQKKRETAK